MNDLGWSPPVFDDPLVLASASMTVVMERCGGDLHHLAQTIEDIEADDIYAEAVAMHGFDPLAERIEEPLSPDVGAHVAKRIMVLSMISEALLSAEPGEVDIMELTKVEALVEELHAVRAILGRSRTAPQASLAHIQDRILAMAMWHRDEGTRPSWEDLVSALALADEDLSNALDGES